MLPLRQFFDLENGKPFFQPPVKDTILVAMDLLDELSRPKLPAQTPKISEHLNDICVCYQQVEEIYQLRLPAIPLSALNAIGIAWQHDHLAPQRKGTSQKFHFTQREFQLRIARSLLGQDVRSRF